MQQGTVYSKTTFLMEKGVVFWFVVMGSYFYSHYYLSCRFRVWDRFKNQTLTCSSLHLNL